MFDLFDDFFDAFDTFTVPMQTKQSARLCPGCGRSWNDFRRTGRFGCDKCYETFRPEATAAIRQIHSTTRHNGKVPSKAGEGIKRKREYEELKRKLQDALKSENYEEAAVLHKKIKAMEKEGI